MSMIRGATDDLDHPQKARLLTGSQSLPNLRHFEQTSPTQTMRRQFHSANDLIASFSRDFSRGMQRVSETFRQAGERISDTLTSSRSPSPELDDIMIVFELPINKLLPPQARILYKWLDAITVSWHNESGDRFEVRESEGDKVLCSTNSTYCDILDLSQGQAISIYVSQILSTGDELKSEPMTVTVPNLQNGFQGQCSLRRDGRWFVASEGFEAKSITSAVSKCAIQTGGIAKATEGCLSAWSKANPHPLNVTLSKECIGCFGKAVGCGRKNCMKVCLIPASDACRQCNHEHCADDFLKCAGFDEASKSQMPPS